MKKVILIVFLFLLVLNLTSCDDESMIDLSLPSFSLPPIPTVPSLDSPFIPSIPPIPFSEESEGNESD